MLCLCHSFYILTVHSLTARFFIIFQYSGPPYSWVPYLWIQPTVGPSVTEGLMYLVHVNDLWYYSLFLRTIIPQGDKPWLTNSLYQIEPILNHIVYSYYKHHHRLITLSSNDILILVYSTIMKSYKTSCL